jgi:hypothetical protein
LDSLDAALAFYSCDNAAEITLLTLLQNSPASIELPASCASIQTACPGTLEL